MKAFLTFFLTSKTKRRHTLFQRVLWVEELKLICMRGRSPRVKVRPRRGRKTTCGATACTDLRRPEFTIWCYRSRPTAEVQKQPSDWCRDLPQISSRGSRLLLEVGSRVAEARALELLIDPNSAALSSQKKTLNPFILAI